MLGSQQTFLKKTIRGTKIIVFATADVSQPFFTWVAEDF